METLSYSIAVSSVGDVKVIRNVSEPTAPQLYRVKRDQFTTYQIKPEDRQPNGVRKMLDRQAGAPAVFRTGTFENHKYFNRTPFGRDYQFMAADLLALRKYGKPYLQLSGTARDDIIRAFGSLYDSSTAFNNVKGVDNCNNYITGAMRGEDPKIDPLICADAIVEVLEVRTNSKGIQMARLNSFRSPAVATLTDSRVLRATIIYKADGHVGEFPQLHGTPVMYPYISSQDVWYPLVDLEAV